MKNKKMLLVIVIGILLVGSLVIGTSYSIWTINKTQTTANNLNSGCFSTTFTDQNNISLTNQFPINDVSGLALSPYSFTITNTCTLGSTYQVDLETLSTTTASPQFIKTSFNSGTPTLLNSYSTTDTTISGATAAYKIQTGYLAPSASVTYTLRLWVTESATTDDMANKIFDSKIVVVTAASMEYIDASGATKPELYQGLVPVKYDASGNTVVADVSQEWYNYTSHNWANAVLVNCSDSTIKNKYFDSNMKLLDSVVGTAITDSDILQYYVWIPRYKYLLWNAANGSSNPQAISITFEDKATTKSSGTTNGTWLTHPAFTFGTTELNGIWVGKFENSGSTTNLTIKPNVSSLRSTTVGDLFNATRNQELTYAANYGILSTQIDTHMMKNMEWGAVAYLTSSIYGRYTDTSTCITSGCEVWINNNSSYTTGCAGASVSASSSTSCNAWNTSTGVNASTTGNQHGKYDMSGGAWEYVMGNMVDSSGNFYPSSSGLSKPDTKYYNSYAYSASTYTDHARGGIGDATKETLKTFGSETGGWYSDYAALPGAASSWFLRGGLCGDGAYAGAFYFGRNAGGA